MMSKLFNVNVKISSDSKLVNDPWTFQFFCCKKNTAENILYA